MPETIQHPDGEERHRRSDHVRDVLSALLSSELIPLLYQSGRCHRIEDIILKPHTKSNMPSAPELCCALRIEGLTEVLRLTDSEDSRRHSLNDAIAIPGVYAGAAPSNVVHPGDVCVFKGGTMLRISDGSVEITGATLTVSGDVIGGGISLDNHTHMGVHGKTSPPL